MSQATTNSEMASLIRPYAEMVEQKLRDYLDRLAGPSRLLEAMTYAGLGPGKRVRPALVLMCNEACDGKTEPALVAGCAVEMMHAYSLVHDDLPSMDDDDLRRGRPTCHKVYGEAMAILAGDALLTEAFGIISKEIESAELVRSLVSELASAGGADGMVAGQSADMEAEQDGGDAAMLDYIHSKGMLVLVETRNAEDLTYLGPGQSPKIVGINNKNIDELEKGEDQLKLTPELIQQYRRRLNNCLLISQSAHRQPGDVRHSIKAGADAVLAGTAFMVSREPAKTVTSFVNAMENAI